MTMTEVTTPNARWVEQDDGSWQPSAAGGSGSGSGRNGKDGATSVTIGTVSTGAPGSAASVTNVGTSADLILNFSIPRGDAGATPTFTIGTITTLAAGSSATATLTGTAPNYVLNLGIPRGADGSGGGGTTVDAALNTKGVLQLNGDLRGNANYPAVPGLLPSLPIIVKSTYDISYSGVPYAVAQIPLWSKEAQGAVIQTALSTIVMIPGNDDLTGTNDYGFPDAVRRMTVIVENTSASIIAIKFVPLPNGANDLTIAAFRTAVLNLVWTGSLRGGWVIEGSNGVVTPMMTQWDFIANDVYAAGGYPPKSVSTAYLLTSRGYDMAGASGIAFELAVMSGLAADTLVLNNANVYQHYYQAPPDGFNYNGWGPAAAGDIILDQHCTQYLISGSTQNYICTASQLRRAVSGGIVIRGAYPDHTTSGSNTSLSTLHETMHGLDNVKRAAGVLPSSTVAFAVFLDAAIANTTDTTTYGKSPRAPVEFFAEAGSAYYYWQYTADRYYMDAVFGNDSAGRANQNAFAIWFTTNGMF